MKRAKIKQLVKGRRAKRVRAKIFGTKTCPRLTVFRSNKGIYVQLIDDEAGKTLASASLKAVKAGEKTDMSPGVARAFALGKMIGEEAGKKKIKKAVFDRGRYAFHGRMKALADGAREAGLKI